MGFAPPTHSVLSCPAPEDGGGTPISLRDALKDADSILYDQKKYAIGDTTFEFLLCPGTEAPAEMTVWIEESKVLVAAEIATHTLHNLLTPRGAEVRDARLWWKALDRLSLRYGDRMEAVCATHHWPIVDQERANAFLLEQRDSYKFLHDQTVRLMNRGYTMLEIAAAFEADGFLPELMCGPWHNRGYYGTISHDVRAIYQKYLGWYDMNPSNLNPLPPEDAAGLYVKAMGGEDNVWLLMKHAIAEGNYRWAAELGKHLVFASPAEENRNLLASVYRKLGYACEAGTWRNMYLTGGKELEAGGPLVFMKGSSANPDILTAMDDELFYDYAASRMDGERADTCKDTFLICMDGRTTFVNVQNRVLNYHDAGNGKTAGMKDAIAFSLERKDFALLLTGGLTAQDAIASGNIQIDVPGGDEGELRKRYEKAVCDWFDLFDQGALNFPIVQPRTR